MSATISFILLTSLIAFAFYKGIILIANNDIYNERYFTININEVSRKWVQNENGTGRYNTKAGDIEIGFQKCGPNGLQTDDQESVEYIGIAKYYCLAQKNYSLFGQYYSDQFRYVKIQVTKCRNTTTFNKCMPLEDIDKYITQKGAQLSFIFVNNYFDSTSYDQPIKSYLDDTFYWSFLPGYNKKTNIYFKRNKIQLSDSYLSGILPDDELKFYQVENFRETLEPQSSWFELAQVYFRYDKQYDNNQRNIYGFSDFLGDVGGFQSSIFFIGALLVSIFSERLFYSSVIKKIYQLENFDKTPDTHHSNNHKRSNTNIGHNESQNKLNIDIQKVDRMSSLQPKKDKVLSIEPSPPVNESQGIGLIKKFSSIIQEKFQENKAEKVHEKLQIFSNFINSENYITSKISRQIHKMLTTRERFSYYASDIFHYLFFCLCFRKKRYLKQKPRFMKHFLYRKGERKVAEELDCIQMIKMIRQMKLLTYVLLTKKQKLLLKFQRRNVLDYDTQSSSDSDKEKLDAFKMLQHKNHNIQKLFTIKLKDTIQSYEAKDLNEIDKKLLRGLHEKYRFDYEESKDKMINTIKKYLKKKVEEEKKKQSALSQTDIKQTESPESSNSSEDIEDMEYYKRFKTVMIQPFDKRRKSIAKMIGFTDPKLTQEKIANANMRQSIILQNLGFMNDGDDTLNQASTDRELIKLDRRTSRVVNPEIFNKIKLNDHSSITTPNTVTGSIYLSQFQNKTTFNSKRPLRDGGKNTTGTKINESNMFDSSIDESIEEDSKNSDIEKGQGNFNSDERKEQLTLNDSWSFNKSQINFDTLHPSIDRDPLQNGDSKAQQQLLRDKTLKQDSSPQRKSKKKDDILNELLKDIYKQDDKKIKRSRYKIKTAINGPNDSL
ncbi:UNKNOWN [Stylonychia lemnae]|uniref:Uncharacterized protein n=1 Tax=Stylonychia lemnae TaxID=5949 RepID=A0A078ALV0_STYLE|nr:UNKNOWN [Stylonychia lemnae]|eukprot:CDW82856.1 UNKNOWN [Stylonychia lemnae]